jgi:hypothetical protein
MSDEQPDYVVCIKHTNNVNEGETWCGKKTVGFVFQGIDHAAYARMNGGRLLVCPDCQKAVSEILAKN